MEYKKNTTYNSIYIKVFYDRIMLYLTVSTDDVINTNNNYTAFTELRTVFEKDFEIKVQEGYVMLFLAYFVMDQYHHINT